MAHGGDSRPEVLDVAVVGGGVAGAYACYQLRHTKRRIGLFEGSGRIGGRLFTYHLPCSPSLNLELGGMRYAPSVHKKLHKLIKTLGLHPVPFADGDATEKPTSMFYLRGKYLTEEDVLHGDVPYYLTPEEKRNQHRLATFYLEKLLGVTNWHQASQGYKLNSPSLKTVTGTPLHMLTFSGALDQVASPDGKAFVNDTQRYPAGVFLLSRSSAHSGFMSSVGYGDVLEFLTIHEGMDALPARLVEAFQTSSNLHGTYVNHQLTSIDKEGPSLYRLHFRCTRTDDVTTLGNPKSEHRQVWANRVILALPVPSLDAIQWKPLQKMSVQAARSLRDNVYLVKIFLFFERPWWRELGKGYSAVISDQVYKMSFEYGHSHGCFALMASYAEYQASNLFGTLQGQGQPIPGSAPGELRVSTALKDFLLDKLSTAYQVPRKLVPEPIGGAVKFWEVGLANWTNGCLNRSVMDELKRPAKDENVFVVGTDVALSLGLHAWIEGALWSVEEALGSATFLPSSSQCKL